MVQSQSHPSRHWQGERMPNTRPPTDDPIYQHRHPMDICTMMKEYCNISLQHFVMAGIDKDGKLVTFTGPRETVNPLVLKHYVDVEGYYNWYNTGSLGPTPSPSSYEDGYFGHGDSGRQASSTYGGRRQYERRRVQPAYDYDDDSLYRTRKRPRGTIGARREDLGPAVQVVVAKRGMRIGDDGEVWKFYEQRFKSIQQSACKTIAKAWIKLIAPKKQSNHPYTGQEAKAPDWWPKPTGNTKEERVRHKEPDHLHKPERIWLLNHILHLITTPNRMQPHRDLQKLNINVAKLEEATWDALSGFFADMENPNNMKKKPYLKEIFRVAKYQERYRNGEIDAETEVMVTADDKVPDDPDDDDPEDAAQNDDANQAAPPSSPKPEHSLPAIAGPDHNTAGNIPSGASFIGDLPVRGHSYPQPSIMQSDLGANSPSYVESSSMGVNSQQSMPQTHNLSLSETYSDHAASRRPSIYTSPTEYAGSSSANLYQNWQQSTPSNASPVYSFHNPQQQPHSAGSYVDQQQHVPLAQTPQYLEAPTFDPMHSGPSSHALPALYRPTSMAQGTMNSHATLTFPNYHSTHGAASLPRPHDENDHKRWNP
ncbi:unnamed protein product [Discula destructiva]